MNENEFWFKLWTCLGSLVVILGLFSMWSSDRTNQKIIECARTHTPIECSLAFSAPSERQLIYRDK
jgi:hypothetical protein